MHRHGQVVDAALVDDADYEPVAAHHWRVSTDGYVYRYRPAAERRRSFRYDENAMIHRELMALPPGLPAGSRGVALVVDHLNGNRLDNRRENLEVVTQAENARRGVRRRWAAIEAEAFIIRGGPAWGRPRKRAA